MNYHIFYTIALCHVDDCLEVLKVAVYSAVGYEPHDVECVAVSCILHCCKECRILEELAGLNRAGDFQKVLVDYASGSDVEVSDLGISHLSCRQAYRLAACFDSNKRIFCEHPVKYRLVCCGNGIAVSLFSDSESVKNH